MKKLLFWLVLCFVMLFASLCSADFYTGTYDYDLNNKYGGLPKGFVLLDYDIDENGVPFAVISPTYIRHVGVSERHKLIDFLISKGLSREEASSFHRIDYYYEFTSDCEKYALAHARFYEKQHSEGESRLIYSYSVDESSKKFHETQNDSVMKEVAKTMFRKKVFDKYELSKKIDKNKRLTIKSKE